MISVYKEIRSVCGVPMMRQSRTFSCDLCEAECDPESCSPADWLFSDGEEHMCFECLLDKYGIEKVNE